MNEKENNLMYALVYQMVKKENYELLHINDQIKEIWLQKYENKVSKVIRLTSQSFDWANHLKRDIAQVFQKTKALKRYLYRKKVEVYNVYITTYAPVDDWEMLTKPMMLKEKQPIRMNVYYLAEEGFEEEEKRLENDLNLSFPEIDAKQTVEDIENDTEHYKKELAYFVKSKREEEENVFAFGKPKMVYLLLAINVLLYFLLEASGGSESIETLIKFGAKYNPAMLIDGEWWRVISSMFLHIGFFHLLMNMIAVYYLGTLVERIYGSWRFIVIYFLAGIGGGLASFTFTTNVSAGASGALFGLFGALLFFGLIYKHLFFKTIGMNLLVLIAINIVFGLTVPQIDNSAHIGGLVAGFIAAAIVYLPKKREPGEQWLAFGLYIILLIGLVMYGIHTNQNDPSYQLTRIDESLQNKQYEEVVEIATETLKQPGDFEALLLFQRSYAYIELDDIDAAIEDLEKSIELESDRPESFYNLALLYEDIGKHHKATEAIEEAYQLNPDDDSYIQLYEEITGETVSE